jgi:hypothetical protein
MRLGRVLLYTTGLGKEERRATEVHAIGIELIDSIEQAVRIAVSGFINHC